MHEAIVHLGAATLSSIGHGGGATFGKGRWVGDRCLLHIVVESALFGVT
jgi:hypothetical protein